jgi:hypothetical protein
MEIETGQELYVGDQRERENEGPIPVKLMLIDIGSAIGAWQNLWCPPTIPRGYKYTVLVNKDR